ncbi:UNVERIFIED_CONTAM: hypothetical protein GTU68_023186 [Idotea baltica]|nr:hypothetical protein [Idotea baltica]
MIHNDRLNDTVIALSTPQGSGAIAVIRITGANTFSIADKLIPNKKLGNKESHTAHFGLVKENDIVVDEVVATVFKAPKTYTGQDIVEISCHASEYIINKIIELGLANGARMAEAGEFTMRAFLNGKLDLAQAEAVADLIASETKTAHEIAMQQMRGGFSEEIQVLRNQLIKFASLIELENDFGEEDVEFANRTELLQTVNNIQGKISGLIESFKYGNAIKKGVPVAIIGSPNVGKSTLLNALLNEEKAIVSPIAGTTRDVIEDTINIDGIRFRFIDTAGIHETEDYVESLGIDRSKAQIEKAQIVIYLAEISEDYETIIQNFKTIIPNPSQAVIIVLNKADEFHTCHQYDVEEAVSTLLNRTKTIALSAKEKTNLDLLKTELVKMVKSDNITANQTILSNARHHQAFINAYESLNRVVDGFKNQTPSDIIALDIRHALQYMGEVSGVITTDDLLDSIFRDFCIGK